MKLMQVTDPKNVITLIDNEFGALESETVSLEYAGGRYLAKTILAPEDVPSFDRSTVDGYAVIARDSFGAGESIPAMIEIIGEVLMGKPAPPIKPGQCCLVHTGGMLPEGADAVIMLEDTEIMKNMMHSFRQVAPGENVIHRGEDLKICEPALDKGHFLRAPELGLLASLGITEVAVHRQPLIGFLSSGDELVNYHTAKLEPGKIRDSNAPALLYLAAQLGASAEYGGILPDQYAVFLKESQLMLSKVDFLVFTGGSSVGSRDYTARTLQTLGQPGLLVEGIAIHPGKPTLLADCGGKPVLGLPGHPVSALNIFAVFGKAIIDRLSGRILKRQQSTVKAVLSRNIASRSGRTDYVRVRLEEEEGVNKAYPVFGRSGMLRTLAEADGMLLVEAGKEGLSAGELVEVFLWE